MYISIFSERMIYIDAWKLRRQCYHLLGCWVGELIDVLCGEKAILAVERYS